MLFWTIVKVCFKSLLANKLRSFLAMLGIIIGVGAVIAMLAMGAGARKQILDRVSAMGTNLLVVRPGFSSTAGVVNNQVQNLTIQDAEAVLNEANDVCRVSPVARGSFQIKYMNKNTRTDVYGVAITYLGIRDFTVEKGRYFTESEADNSARVVILGPETVRNLFEHDEPVGAVVKIKGINFTVIGVTRAKGDQGFFNPDDQAYVPYTTGMTGLMGQRYLREIDVQARAGADLLAVEKQVSNILRRRHHIPPMSPEDFTVRNQADMLEVANEVGQTFTILLASIASISLLVGGIGIMNIMLVTVTERTREIGIRKAIGARQKSILLQFLIEAIIISGFGGIIGVVFGISGAKVIGLFSSYATIVQVPSIFIALSFSAVVGIFFGWYPARRAARLDPVEALRYE